MESVTGSLNTPGLVRVLRLMHRFDADGINEASHTEILNRFCEAAIESGYRLAVFASPPAGEGQPCELLAQASCDVEPLPCIDLGWTAVAETHLLTTARSGTYSYQVATHMKDDPRYAPWRGEIVRWGCESALSMWNFADEGLRGTLALFAEEPNAFGEQEQLVLEIVLTCLLAAARIARRKGEMETQQARTQALLDSMNEIVFAVGKGGAVTYANPALERVLGYPTEGFIGRDFREIVDPDDLLLLAAHFQHEAPELRTGVECSVRGKDGQIRRLHLTAVPFHSQPGEFVGIARDVTEQRRIENELLDAFEGTIKALGDVMVARDAYTASHQGRVAHLAAAIARELGLEEERVRAVRYAGLVHDIGKMSIPSQILAKPARLSPAERSLLEEHPRIAYDALSKIAFPWPIARIVLEHHERIDGSGYPNGRAVGETLLESRVLAVADVVEAMSSHRPYRPALGIVAALQEISEKRGILYDASVVEACLRFFARRGYRAEAAPAPS